MTAPALVHGMGKELTEPDWPPLTTAEVRGVLAGYRPAPTPAPAQAANPAPALAANPAPALAAKIIWRSPRPFAASALVRWGDATVFIKRHHKSVRTAKQFAAEHAFAAHLRSRRIATPRIFRTQTDGTSLTSGDYVYEVHERAAGADLYRDAMSWTPFRSLHHAETAGAALARLHVAAADCTLPARPWGVLMTSQEIITASDPLEAIGRLLRSRPGLAAYLEQRDWRQQLGGCLLPLIERAGPLLAGLPAQWGHGDWHPSNLTWTSARADADVADVFDLGLANRTTAVHDLAVALERSTIGWLDLAEWGHADASPAAIDALLRGYESVRPLDRAEAHALAEVLPVAHVEYALSEIEYFADVVRHSDLADLAYDGYLLGHARWFAGSSGTAVLDHLRRRIGPR
jgi:Ser/Thr protein kinase RdoA (MazF antagonist)